MNWGDCRKYIKKADLLDFFLEGKEVEVKNSYRVAKNTLFIIDKSGTNHIQYYQTTVCSFNAKTRILVLDTGGHTTRNTVDRMNIISPVEVKRVKSRKEVFIRIDKIKIPIADKLKIKVG